MKIKHDIAKQDECSGIAGLLLYVRAKKRRSFGGLVLSTQTACASEDGATLSMGREL
jgi:hypothetical protein